jgi:hypothetical protein
MNHNHYCVTGRAAASVIFRQDDSLTINYIRDGISGKLTFATRYLEAGFEVPVPGDLMVVVETEAETTLEAFTWLTVGRELASIISIATNAAIAPIKGELAYDITPGKTERELFQRFMPGDEITLSSRTVPMDATLEVLELIANSKHRNRLVRAITQYNEALLRWELGNELLVVAHLWMGVEAITKAYVRLHLEQRGISESELATEWGFKPKGGYMQQESFLSAEARVRLVCQGDALHHKIARQVSDRFEHGLANGGALFGPARDALMPIARYLREAIFVVAGVSEEHRDALMTAPYARPRGLGGLEQYFRTTLVGDSEVLADEGRQHPCCDWEHTILSATFDEDSGLYSYKPNHNMTARIGKGLQLVGGTLEVWDAGHFTPESAAEKAAKGAPETPDKGSQPK